MFINLENNYITSENTKEYFCLYVHKVRLTKRRSNTAVLWRISGPVHTNPFSNENGAVLLRFQNDLRPHLSFSYCFRPSTLQRHFGYSRTSSRAYGRVYFHDVTVFRQHRFLRSRQKTAFSKSIVFKSLHSRERFRMAPFSVIVFGVVVCTIAVS